MALVHAARRRRKFLPFDHRRARWRKVIFWLLMFAPALFYWTLVLREVKAALPNHRRPDPGGRNRSGGSAVPARAADVRARRRGRGAEHMGVLPGLVETGLRHRAHSVRELFHYRLADEIVYFRTSNSNSMAFPRTM